MMIFVPHCICAITITSNYLSSPKGLLLPLLYCTVQYSKLSSVHVLHNTPYVTVERILYSCFTEVRNIIQRIPFYRPPENTSYES
jgi:hypothetical protein